MLGCKRKAVAVQRNTTAKSCSPNCAKGISNVWKKTKNVKYIRERYIPNPCLRQAGLKRDINLVVVKTLKKGKWGHKLYFSTDLDLSGRTLLDYYRKRFQIEFIFRGAKQHAGLEHCQARSTEKLHFHWNASLTAVNLAKAAHRLPLPRQERGAFSMSDVKTLYNNDLMLKRFLCVFAIDPNRPKNTEKIRQLLTYGARAA